MVITLLDRVIRPCPGWYQENSPSHTFLCSLTASDPRSPTVCFPVLMRALCVCVCMYVCVCTHVYTHTQALAWHDVITSGSVCLRCVSTVTVWECLHNEPVVFVSEGVCVGQDDCACERMHAQPLGPPAGPSCAGCRLCPCCPHPPGSVPGPQWEDVTERSHSHHHG